MDTADPVLPQVWRWTTNRLATMSCRVARRTGSGNVSKAIKKPVATESVREVPEQNKDPIVQSESVRSNVA